MFESHLKNTDKEVYQILEAENTRQDECLEMIASENFVSQSVLEASSSTLTNKYAEGYPNRRYYNGCVHADGIETLARTRLKELFQVKYVNVQPHSGAQANMAVFLHFLKPNDTFLGLHLNHGGHLTHGSHVNISGKYFRNLHYSVDKTTHRIDFNEVRDIARKERPKLIIAGASAYPRTIDFQLFREIADEVGAVLMADIAHIAGLIAVGEHPNSIGVAHVSTSTTHKTLRGPRGGVIMTDDFEMHKGLNSAVFPGTQGGPLMHTIAAKAVAFGEALDPSYKDYIKKVVQNAKVLAEELIGAGINLVTGGTDNHIVLLDLIQTNVTGHDLANALDEIGITANKNAIPFDPQPPMISSGVRLGTPALTTRGLETSEFKKIAHIIARLIHSFEDNNLREKLKQEVQEITRAYPMKKFKLI